MAFPSDVWNAAGKTVALSPSEKGNAPLVLLHTVQGEGEDVYRKARGMTDADFSFAAVGGLRWDDEMSPGESPPLFKGDTPCTGGADAYLATLTGNILPEILSRPSAAPSFLALAGYSTRWRGCSPSMRPTGRIASRGLPAPPAPFGSPASWISRGNMSR